MNKNIYVLFAVMIMMLFAAQSANAVTYDLWNMFPDNQGDNGIYAYGYYGGPTLLDDVGSYRFGRINYQWNVPYIQKGTDPWIITHPWSDMDSQLVWVVPETNTYDIQGAFNDWGDGGYVYTYILKNNNIIWSSYLGTGTVDFDLGDVALSANDKIAFGVGYAGSTSDDTTRYWAQIDAASASVPEPASASLLSLGLLGFLRLRKRKV